MAHGDKVAAKATDVQPGWLISCPDQTGGYRWSEVKAVRPAEDRPGYLYVDAQVIDGDGSAMTFLTHFQANSVVLVKKPV